MSKHTRLKQAARAMEAMLPEFAARGTMLFRVPIKAVAGIVALESSSADGKCYVDVALVPLFVPATVFTYNVGFRLGRLWDVEELTGATFRASFMSAAIPFLAAAESPETAALAVLKLERPSDPYVTRALAYCQAAAQRLDDATRAFDRTMTLLATEPVYDWKVDLLREVMEASSPGWNSRLNLA